MTNSDGRKAELEARNSNVRASVIAAGRLAVADLSVAGGAGGGDGGHRRGDLLGWAGDRANAVGIVTDVQISPSAFKSSTPEKLARSFLAAAQAAAQDARAKADAAMAPLQEGVPDFFPGAPSLKDLVPAPPEPTTPPVSPNPPENDDWDDFEPRSGFQKDLW